MASVVDSPSSILFLCVANSARSQMAEGIARSLAPPGTRVFSAGSAPTRINPLARQVLAEFHVDTAGQVAKSVEDLADEPIDLVITLCAEEVCPAWLGSAPRLHWPLPDPATVTGPERARLEAFRLVRDELLVRIRDLFAMRR